MNKEKKEEKKPFSEKLQFILAKKKIYLCSSVVLLFLFSFFINQTISSVKKKKIEKIALLTKSFKEWEKDQSSENYNKLITLMEKNPKISAHLKTDITQKLLYKKDRAQDFGEKVLSDLALNDSCFLDFARISLLISEEKYEESYEKSLALQKSIETDKKTELKLYPYNLLRISFLAKKLENKQKEAKAWNELEGFIKEDQGVSEEFLSEFKENNKFELIDYISFRKKNLSN
jgi:hypothetical protein